MSCQKQRGPLFGEGHLDDPISPCLNPYFHGVVMRIRPAVLRRQWLAMHRLS